MLFSIKELINITGGELLVGDGFGSVSGAIIDSREAVKGSLFFPLQGENQNGHHFMIDALKRGAAASIMERSRLQYFNRDDFPAEKNVIVVDNCLRALQELATFHRNSHDLDVVAVTGSNGKTTTKDMIASVLQTRYRVLKTEGNFNNDIGLPLTLLRIKPEHQVAVLEMGMRGRGEIALLCSLSRPKTGVITNVGESHLELLGSKENISKAKGELLESLGADDTAVLNGDDPFVKQLGAAFKGRTVYYGFSTFAELRAQDISFTNNGYAFSALLPEDVTEEFWVPLPGKHNVYNALAAVAVGLTFSLTYQEIREGLALTPFSGMRMERIGTKSGLKLINDAYNASPTSMEFALQSLKEWAAKSLSIAVLGDMLELGAYEKEGHLRTGRVLAGMGVDYLLTVGKQAALIGEGAKEAGMSAQRIFTCSEHAEALKVLKTLPLERGFVLVKGSRGMSMENIVNALLAEYN